jgi:hypothetical protein
MKVNQVILVLLGALSVEAIRMNVHDDDNSVPDDIKKDAAEKGLDLENADSATVANVAANVGKLQEKIESEALAKREATRAAHAEVDGISTYE